ncbi:MmcQ/YjbR family DNA-binding protein [Actinomycetaceae bacterium L2_0104]
MEGIELQRVAYQRAEELPGSHLDHPFGPDWDVFKVRGKAFMLQTRLASTPIVTLKATPRESELLRETYREIQLGG